MRRASTGTVAAASAACRSARGLADGSPAELVLGAGLAWTVGNRPDGSVGETPVPDIAGSVVPGGKVVDELGMVVLAATTRSEAVPLNDRAPVAVASAEMCARSPAVAVDRTGIRACSSAAWPTGNVPTAHVALPGSGHTVNVGVPTKRPPLALARTDTARLVAFVDQTQITNVASCPALTSPAPESGWIRTHSCGVAFLGFGLELGFGEEELGFGLGLEELGVGLGVVVELGLGVVVAGVDDAAPDEDVDAEVVGLDDGLSLVDVAGELADFVDFADLAVVDDDGFNGDAEELASAAARSCLAALLAAAESTVLLGMSGHAELMTDWLLASAACSSANMLQPMNAKPVSAPSAAGLRISALTCESSCTVWLRSASRLHWPGSRLRRHDSHIMHGCPSAL